jgi:hypothetical protein
MFRNLWADRPSNDGDVIEHPDRELSREAARYAAALEERTERSEALCKAAEIIGRYISANRFSTDPAEGELAELDSLRRIRRTLAKAAAGQLRGSRVIEKLSGKVYGTFHGASGEWHTQREIDDPQSEAESGVDFDSETDDVDVDDFLKMIGSADPENDDETSAHLHRCGLHLCKAKLAHLSGDHEQCTRSINAAMDSYGKFHRALKSQTEGD